MANQTETTKVITVGECLLEQGKLVLKTPEWDFDEFGVVGDLIVSQLAASLLEKQTDADLHSWLIDFEGCQFLLKAEHYSETVWLEALNPAQSQEECKFLATWLS
jgi:hypothetical protein